MIGLNHEVYHKAHLPVNPLMQEIVIVAADGCIEWPEGQSYVDPQDQQLQPSKCCHNGILQEEKMPEAHHPLDCKFSW